MKKIIAAVFWGNNPLFFFLVLMLCLVGLMNISIAFFGELSPSQFAARDFLNFGLAGAAFLAGAAVLFWIGTKTVEKKSAKNERFVFSSLASVIFISLFLGFISVFYPIRTMEGIFGKEAGRAIFFRLLATGSVFSILFGLVGMAASLLICRACKKIAKGKKPLPKKQTRLPAKPPHRTK